MHTDSMHCTFKLVLVKLHVCTRYTSTFVRSVNCFIVIDMYYINCLLELLHNYYELAHLHMTLLKLIAYV